MRVSSTWAAVVGGVLGLAFAVLALNSSWARLGPASQNPSEGTAQTQPVTPAPQARTRFADCVPPARLKRGECVTRVERTVVVAAPPSSSRSSAVLPLPTRTSGRVQTHGGGRDDGHRRGADDGKAWREWQEDRADALEDKREGKDDWDEEVRDAWADYQEDRADEQEDQREDRHDDD